KATLFIPAVGWAVFGAVVFVDLAPFLGSRLAYEVGLRGLLACAVPLVLIAGAVWWWIGINLDVKKLYVDPAMAELGGPTWSMIQQFESLSPQVRPHSTVVFLDDPFEGYDMFFIAQLWFRDPTLVIRLQRKTPLSPAGLARADYLFNA